MTRGRGFTLLEVMVALALLASALMALADLAGSALRNHVYARDLTAATLLARGKMVELEQKYEDQGFRDVDESEEGDFSDQGRPDIRWRLLLVRPDPDLSADQLVSTVAGQGGGNMQDLIGKLMGSALGGAASSAGGTSSSTVTAGASASPIAGLLSGVIQKQMVALGEELKKSFREARLTVGWRDGKLTREFTVTTHLLVLNPRAPNNAHGDNPDVPPNLAAGALPAAVLDAARAGALSGGQVKQN